MKFYCTFQNPATGECRTVTACLTREEVAKAMVADDSELYVEAYALRRAYREVPEGFFHESVQRAHREWPALLPAIYTKSKASCLRLRPRARPWNGVSSIG